MSFDYTMNTGQHTENNHPYVDLNPHPDGQPWPKCCRSEGICCAFVRNQDGGERISSKDGDCPAVQYPTKDGSNEKKKAAEVPFFCAHRVVDGYHRVCAGWDAVFGNKHLAAQK